MSSETSAGVKLCCKCGKDVTHVGRLKASDGRYWCFDCGDKDEETKTATAGGVCFRCSEPFSKTQLTHIGGHTYCVPCVKKQFNSKRSIFSQLWRQITGKG
jgi:formylmethanofuran dehydrogenase subunit E